MKKNICFIIMAVVYTLVAAFFGGLIEKFEPGGNLPTVFAVTVMGASILYAVLAGKKAPDDGEKSDDTEKTDGGTDKPE